MTTNERRKAEFDSVSTVHETLNPMIKIMKPDSETCWLSITEEELLKIQAFLLESSR